MDARNPSGNFGGNDDDGDELWSRKTRVKHRAEDLSMQEFGDALEAWQYLTKAEGEIKWESLVAAFKKDGWRLVEEYKYLGPDGADLFQSVRFQYVLMPSKKRFLLKHTGYNDNLVLSAGPVRVPYNLVDVLARKGERLRLVEGEKAVNTCKALGLRATCVQGQLWTDDVCQFFAGEEVDVCMDNDDAGHKNTARALEWLAKVGAKVRVPDLGLAPRAGLDDWLAEHTVEELVAVCDATPVEPGPAHLTLINPADWEGVQLLDRVWVVDPLVPEKNVTSIYGDGGLGKSLVTLQLATARAIGQRWLGLQTLPGRTLVLSAEDDADELHRRLATCALHYNVPLGALGAIRLVDLVGQDAVMGELARSGRIVATELYQFMVNQIVRFKPGLVVVDALADSFAGDENNRTQARQFISMLRRPARDHGCAFLAVAHPSLSGMASGRGTSGTTGWSNSVRSRMYLETVEQEGTEPDPNLKRLCQRKANYSAAGFELLVRYTNGVYVPVTDAMPLDRMAKQAQAEEVFLRCLQRLSAQERYVSNSTGANYAPKVFSAEPEATEKLLSKEQLKGAMLRLFERQLIALESYGPPSKRRHRIVVRTTM